MNICSDYVFEYYTPTLGKNDILYYTIKNERDILSAIETFHRYFPQNFIRIKSIIEVREIIDRKIIDRENNLQEVKNNRRLENE